MVTHSEMAKSLLSVLLTSGLNVPVKDVENMVEIKAWLLSIADGNLVVQPAAEIHPSQSR